MKALLCSFALVICFSGMLFAQNTIDGVTAASWDATSMHKGLKIIGGKAYATYAEIEWWDFYSNGGVHELKWGKTATYDSTRNLKPFTKQTNVTTKIEGLTPNTKYYAEFHRTYPSKNSNVFTKFEFTTAPTTAIIPAPILRTPSLLTATQVALFSVSGQRVAVKATDRYLVASELFTGVVAPGLYVARVLDGKSKTIHSYQCVIEK